MKLAIFFCLAFVTAIYADLPCNCRLGVVNRVINGQYAPTNLVPWIVSLATLDGNHFCGGSIVNENWILTAAHCTQGKNAEEVLIRVGLHVLNDINMESKTYRVKAIHQFGISKPGEFGDFAMLEIDGPIRFVENEIEPGCLNLVDTTFTDVLLTAGWGYTSRPFANPETGSPVPTSNVSPILKYYFSRQLIQGCADHDICTEALDVNDSACQGDSGSPLQYTKDGRTSVVGLVSFVTSQPHEGKIYFCVSHAAFTRLSMYANLIEQVVGKNYCV